jgi:uncharacterized protein (DUF433 family)
MTVAATTLDGLIDVTPGVAGGRPRVAGRRIKVQDIAVWHERLGWSVDEIAAEYGLTLAEVHAALAYYFAHLPEIDAAIVADATLIAEMRASTPSKVPGRLDAR